MFMSEKLQTNAALVTVLAPEVSVWGGKPKTIGSHRVEDHNIGNVGGGEMRR